MKKKIAAIIATSALCLSMSFSALAAPIATPPVVGYGFCCGGYGLMRGDNGYLLDQSTFEENLDNLIESGLIQAEDRDFFLKRYEWCSTSGARGGRGMGWRMYR